MCLGYYNKEILHLSICAYFECYKEVCPVEFVFPSLQHPGDDEGLLSTALTQEMSVASR